MYFKGGQGRPYNYNTLCAREPHARGAQTAALAASLTGLDRVTAGMLDAQARETAFLKFRTCVAPSGWLIVADEPSNSPTFKAALLAVGNVWDIERCAKGMLFAQKGGA